MDRFSPVAPAYTRVLILPVGEIERLRYLAFVERLRNEASIITLAEVEPYVRDEELLLSPQAFRRGSLLYHYTTSVANEQHEQLSPYELFREPLLVIGIKDGLIDQKTEGQDDLPAAAEYLRERHSRVVLRQLLVLERGEDESRQAPSTVISVRNAEQTDDASLLEAICRISARFLVELSTYTKAMQASPGIQTPGQTARGLQRTESMKDDQRRPGSGHTTPPPSSEVSSPVDDSRLKSPPSNRGSPATSFDQIAISHAAVSGLSGSDITTKNKGKHGRASSQDRVSVQGFGSGTSQEKLKNRGKARVGIVIGTIHLMAGQWNEAMRMLVEHTNKARLLADHLWHAKGLENITICMLLQAWTGLDFQIPSICSPVTERTSTSSQRFSVNLPRDGGIGTSDWSQQGSMSRLSKTLPDLLKFIVSLYRAGEGSLELPFICVADVAVRFSKFLASIHANGGELDGATLGRQIRQSSKLESDAKSNRSSSTPTYVSSSKTIIADMLSYAQPIVPESTTVADHVAILGGIISVYGLLGMERKKARTMRELIILLTSAMNRARKRGAADMGMHPATSLSADSGAEAMFATTESSSGLSQMMEDLAAIYGMPLPGSASEGQHQSCPFGSDGLKVNVIRDLAAFCESSPDPHGVLRLNASFLRFFGPNAAVDTGAVTKSIGLSKEEQTRLIASIDRTIGISKHLGFQNMEATYWDPFLVRGLEFMPPDANQVMIERSKLTPGTASTQQSSGNPLLYDPNASRPGTSDQAQHTFVLVQNEISMCNITLQNPYEVSIDVESIELVTEGVELKTSHQAVSLSPMRLQKVSLSVSPCSTGDCRIKGCRVKISGCAERTFPVFKQPWAATAPTLIKEHGNEARLSQSSGNEQQNINHPEPVIVSATTIEPQPTLNFQNSSLLQSSRMLLDGEQQELRVQLYNDSDVAASVFNIISTSDIMKLQTGSNSPGCDTADDAEDGTSVKPTLIQPGGTGDFNFVLTGRPGMTTVQAAFHYSRVSDAAQYARMLSVRIQMTVNAALQLQNFNVFSLEDDSDDLDTCMISFDAGNAWPKSLSYKFSAMDKPANESNVLSTIDQEGVLAPGEIQRIFLRMPKLTVCDFAAKVSEAIRKSLLGRLRARWRCEDRTGNADLSGLILKPEFVESMVRTPLKLNLALLLEDDDASPSKSYAKAGSFATVQARVSNRSNKTTMPLLVELRSNDPNPSAVQDHQKIAIAGTQYRVLKPLEEGEDVKMNFTICPLLSGTFRMDATVRPGLPPPTGEDRRWTTTGSLDLDVT